MKKLILIMLMLFQMSFAYGQLPQCEDWSFLSSYSGIATRVLEKKYNPDTKKYSWKFRVKNLYTKKIVFEISYTLGEESSSVEQVALEPGESYNHIPMNFNSSEYDYKFKISKVCFNGKDCNVTGYLEPNDEQAKLLVSEINIQTLDTKFPKNGNYECLYNEDKLLIVFKDGIKVENTLFSPNGKVKAYQKIINGYEITNQFDIEGKLLK